MPSFKRLWANLCHGILEKPCFQNSSKRWTRSTKLESSFFLLLLLSVILLFLFTLTFTLTTPTQSQQLKRLQGKLTTNSRSIFENQRDHQHHLLLRHQQSSLDKNITLGTGNGNITGLKKLSDKISSKEQPKEAKLRVNFPQERSQNETEKDKFGNGDSNPQNTKIANGTFQQKHPSPQKNTILDKNITNAFFSPSSKRAPKKGALTISANNDNNNDSFWTDVPEHFPAWVRLGLRWNDGPIAQGQPHWQVLDKGLQAFFYAAHFDDFASPPIVRVVGLLHKAFSFLNVTCHYYYYDVSNTLHARQEHQSSGSNNDDIGEKGSGVPSSGSGPGVHRAYSRVSGVVYHFRGLNGRKYVGAHADCPLPAERRGYLPYAVSISRNLQEQNPPIFMNIHYSQSEAWLKQQNYSNHEKSSESGGYARKEVSSMLPQNEKEEENREFPEATGRGSSTWKWNVTRCFPAIQRGFNDHVTVAEMVAASVAVGVERFVFYVQSVGPDLMRMLKMLERRGLAEIHPWNLRLTGTLVFYAAQSSAIQDCFNRHLRSSRFLLFGDLDELFVPRGQHRSLLPLLKEVLSDNNRCGAVLFRNVFYNLNPPSPTHHPPLHPHPPSTNDSHPPFPTLHPPSTNDSHPSSPALPQLSTNLSLTHSVHIPEEYRHHLAQLKMLTHTRRLSHVWPPKSRSKPAVDPRRVITPGIHVVERFRKGYELCALTAKQGLLHHYRLVTSKQAGPMKEVEDVFLWHYTRDILQNFHRLMEEFHSDA